MSSNLLMSLLRLNVCTLCVPNIMNLGVCFIEKLHLVKVGAFAWYSITICVIFGVWIARRKVYKKSKPTQKLKHANSILKSFEYFCQMSSKSNLINLRYTVSKFARFFWDTAYMLSAVVLVILTMSMFDWQYSPRDLSTTSCIASSESHNIRTSSVPSVKRTLSWIEHSRSFKVILIGDCRNSERCVVVMCHKCRRYFISETYEDMATGKRQIRRFKRPNSGLKTSQQETPSNI